MPDIYDLASIIESVVSPQHTCILVNTTNALGIESYLEQRFPTNVVLSLVSGAEISQLGASEFEHKGATELWVGAANRNPSIPASIQTDMAEALAMTLKSGQVDCEVSPNIRQQQYERMIGYVQPTLLYFGQTLTVTSPIAFQPASVIFDNPSHAELLEKVGVRSLITGVIDELVNLAQVQGCRFLPDFREQTMEQMIASPDTQSIMYQDFVAQRPMEVETFLGSPMKLAQEAGVQVPRIETLYAMLHNVNITNQNRAQRQAPPSPVQQQGGPSRQPSAPPSRAPSYGPGPVNGQRQPVARPGSRPPPTAVGPPPAGMRRGPQPIPSYPPRSMGNGYGPRGPPQQMQTRPSFEGNDLEEFSHVMLYDDMPEGQGVDHGYDGMTHSPSGDLAFRERELALRQKEIALRERELNMRRTPRMPPPPPRGGYDDDDEDGDDYFDPMAQVGPPPGVDPENLDMMSVTSRRTRKAPSASQFRNNPEMMNGGPPRQSRMPWKRPQAKNRTSATIMGQMPNLHEELMGNPMMGYSSDRYGNVDRMNMGQESRANSLTAERLDELHQSGAAPPVGYVGPRGPYPPVSRRGSQSPGNPFSPGQRLPHRNSPPNGYNAPPGPNGYGPAPGPNGRPSPPAVRQPVPRHPPGHGNAVAPQQIEQHTGVSNLYPPKSGPQVRSLTGSASASAGSGDSNRSAPIDSEPSAHSSSSSLGPRPPVGTR